MEEEQKYLKNTISTINYLLSEYTLEIANRKSQISLSKEQLTLNFDDMDNEEVSRHKVSIDSDEQVIEIMKKDQSRLEKQVNKPYFGRIDFQTKTDFNKIYIGLGFVKSKNAPLVYDWRAPISSMYYDYNQGKASYICENGKVSGEIILKRQYSIDKQKLNFYIDTRETINDNILQLTLSQNTSSKMREIVSTIQQEQNKLIRMNDLKNLLVQGVAGSGKTSIALHRAGYLLYKNKELFNSNDILILSPSSMFSNYISEVLPELGEDNIVETTFQTISKAELNAPMQDKEEMIEDLFDNKTNKRLRELAYKASFSFLDDLLSFLNNDFVKTFRPNKLSFGTKSAEDPIFEFTKEELENLYYTSYAELPIVKRLDYMADYLVERFNLKKNDFLPVKNRFVNMLYRFFPTTDIEKILSLFLSTKGIAYTFDKFLKYEDVAGLLVIKDFVFGLSTDIPSKYIIIDEMQDFTPAHFYIFNKLWDCQKLLLGDINQCVEKRLTPNYLSKLAKYMNCKKIELNKTYRSTKQISEFCEKLIGLEQIENVCREGDKPDIKKSSNQVKDIVELVSKNFEKYKHIAIICKTSKEMNFLYEKLKRNLNIHKLTNLDNSIDYNVLITTAAASKGIEFDFVIVPNIDKDNYQDILDRNLLYIACTRALHKLTLLYSKDLTPLIRS